MRRKGFSLKNVISSSIVQMNGKCRRIFAVSIVQYMMFLLPFLFTRSLMISFALYVLFMPGVFNFLSNIDEHKAEDAFKLNKGFLTQLLISLIFVFAFGVGCVLLIFPAVIFFANYALVFNEAKDNSKDVLSAFKDAKNCVKGYRGKMALLCLVFMLIFVLLVGLGILISWLFSLFIPALTFSYGFIWSFLLLPMYCYVGAILGVSAFLIFVLPVALLAISNMKGAIAQDKLYKSANANKEPEEKQPKNQQVLSEEAVEPANAKEDNGEPEDFIY